MYIVIPAQLTILIWVCNFLSSAEERRHSKCGPVTLPI